MALLTEADLAALRDEIGDATPEEELQARYDRLGSVSAVAASVVRRRLNELLSGPSSFTVTGVYSESNDAVIRALQTKLTQLTAAAAGEAERAVASAQGGVSRESRLVRRDRCR